MGNNFSQKLSHKARKRYACLVLLLLFSPMAAQAETVPLKAFEERLVSNVRLLSANEAVYATQQGVRFETARSGAQIVVQTGIDPQRQIVARGLVNRSFRYDHSVGLSFPLYGSKAAQREAVANAEADEADARATLDEVRRRTLTDVRQSYVLYWLSERQRDLTASYRYDLDRATPMAQTLRRRGFWTEADNLRFLQEVEKAKADLNKATFNRAQALAGLQGILGSNIGDFSAEEPAFKEESFPSLHALLDSSAAHDLELQHIQGQIDRFAEFERYAKFRSIESNLTTALGTTVDIPNGIGYGLTAGFTLAIPTHADVANTAYEREIHGELASLRDQKRARAAELAAAVQKAYDERLATLQDLQASRAALPFTREDLRETRFRFENIPQTTFNDVLERLTANYASSSNELMLRAAALSKTYDLFYLAPDAE